MLRCSTLIFETCTHSIRGMQAIRPCEMHLNRFHNWKRRRNEKVKEISLRFGPFCRRSLCEYRNPISRWDKCVKWYVEWQSSSAHDWKFIELLSPVNFLFERRRTRQFSLRCKKNWNVFVGSDECFLVLLHLGQFIGYPVEPLKSIAHIAHWKKAKKYEFVRMKSEGSDKSSRTVFLSVENDKIFLIQNSSIDLW